ncbi:MAG: DUF805 domain-containing protein, partial [Hyphomicrobiales bacterium]
RFNDLNAPKVTGVVFTFGLFILKYTLGWGYSADWHQITNFIFFTLILSLIALETIGLAFLGFHRGTIGENAYGDDPFGGTPVWEQTPEASSAKPHFNWIRLFLLPAGRLPRIPFLALFVSYGILTGFLVYQSFSFALELSLTLSWVSIVLTWCLIVAMLWVLGCLAAKRMHDVGRYGFWPAVAGQQIFYVWGELTRMKFSVEGGPVLGYIMWVYIIVLVAWVLYELLAKSSQSEDNQFGPAPAST